MGRCHGQQGCRRVSIGPFAARAERLGSSMDYGGGQDASHRVFWARRCSHTVDPPKALVGWGVIPDAWCARDVSSPSPPPPLRPSPAGTLPWSEAWKLGRSWGVPRRTAACARLVGWVVSWLFVPAGLLPSSSHTTSTLCPAHLGAFCPSSDHHLLTPLGPPFRQRRLPSAAGQTIHYTQRTGSSSDPCWFGRHAGCCWLRCSSSDMHDCSSGGN